VQRSTALNLLLEGSRQELEQPVLFPALLGKSEKTHGELLDALSITLSKTLFTNTSEQTGHVLRLGLQNEEEFLILFQLPARVLVQSFQVEGVLGRNVFAAEKSSDIASVMLLVLDNLVKCDLVLHKQCNLDVQLIDVLLSKFVLSNVLHHSLS